MSDMVLKFLLWLGRRSPATKQTIIGAGLAFDPLPAPRYKTFEESDRLALLKDRISVFGR